MGQLLARLRQLCNLSLAIGHRLAKLVDFPGRGAGVRELSLQVVNSIVRPLQLLGGLPRPLLRLVAVLACLRQTSLYVAEPRLSEYLSALDHPARPTVLPAYTRVVVASDGNTWVQLYSPDLLAPAWWDIFSPEREWLGQAQTPEGFFALSINRESLAGLWLDEFGVEHVRVYQMRPN